MDEQAAGRAPGAPAPMPQLFGTFGGVFTPTLLTILVPLHRRRRHRERARLNSGRHRGRHRLHSAEQRASIRVPGAHAILVMTSVDPVVTRRNRALFWVKVVHTVVWAVFAGCIVAVPFVLWLGRLSTALVLVALVTVEVIVLVANGMTCPLTDVAARFTDDRRDNFDIFLPLWLARHNKRIFGSLFALDLVLVLAWWLRGNTGPS